LARHAPAARLSRHEGLRPGGFYRTRGAALVVVVAGQVDVVDGDVDRHDLQCGHPLDHGDHVAADGDGQGVDWHAVLGDDVEVDGGLGSSDVHRHALGDVGTTGAGDQFAYRAEGAHPAGSHVVNPGDFPGGDTGDLLHDAVSDRGSAPLGEQLAAGRCQLVRAGACRCGRRVLTWLVTGRTAHLNALLTV